MTAPPDTAEPALALAMPAATDAAPPPAPATPLSTDRKLLLATAVIAVLALLAALLNGQRIGPLREQLARQTADAQAQANEARAAARRAEELVRDTAARLAVNDAKLSEVALQRSQLESLMQSLSRSRDENLVVDIESALRLAQQQAQLTGSTEPLLAALRTAGERIDRAAQPRLASLQRAIARDVERVKAAALADTAGVLARIDELVRMADSLPVANDSGQPAPAPARAGSAPADGAAAWWQRAAQPVWQAVRDEARSLVRVRRIDTPEAALIAPDQAFFLRENWKLQVLNLRLAVLARQPDSARADLQAASGLLARWFDTSSRRTQSAANLLQQIQPQLQATVLPRIDETLAALATAAR